MNNGVTKPLSEEVEGSCTDAIYLAGSQASDEQTEDAARSTECVYRRCLRLPGLPSLQRAFHSMDYENPALA